jgi:hypothetical protein
VQSRGMEEVILEVVVPMHDVEKQKAALENRFKKKFSRGTFS